MTKPRGQQQVIRGTERPARQQPRLDGCPEDQAAVPLSDGERQARIIRALECSLTPLTKYKIAALGALPYNTLGDDLAALEAAERIEQAEPGLWRLNH